MPKHCLQCIISGKVQGVFYRAGAQSQANKLGVTGWVRNLPDGSVETLICGDEATLDAMQKWLATGPFLARVDHIEVKAVYCSDEPAGFTVLD